MMCMKAGSDTVKSDVNRACSLRYPCPRAERGRGKWGDGIDGPDGPKEGAVRFGFDGNHRKVRILFLEFRYEWYGLFCGQTQVQDLLKEYTVTLSVGIQPSALVE